MLNKYIAPLLAAGAAAALIASPASAAMKLPVKCEPKQVAIEEVSNFRKFGSWYLSDLTERQTTHSDGTVQAIVSDVYHVCHRGKPVAVLHTGYVYARPGAKHPEGMTNGVITAPGYIVAEGGKGNDYQAVVKPLSDEEFREVVKILRAKGANDLIVGHDGSRQMSSR